MLQRSNQTVGARANLVLNERRDRRCALNLFIEADKIFDLICINYQPLWQVLALGHHISGQHGSLSRFESNDEELRIAGYLDQDQLAAGANAFKSSDPEELFRRTIVQDDLVFSRRATSLLVLAGVAFSGCAGAAMAPSQSLHQRIEAASSRADHQALATYFSAEAAQARAKAAEHRDMIQAYQRQVAAGRSNANMPTHCNMLIKGYESMATEYELMAVSHRQMAEQTNP